MMQRLPRLKKKIVPYALLFPTFLILGYILIYPALRNCFLSLWKWKLICISSVVGRSGKAFIGTSPAYAAAKGALISYTRSLARECGPYGITANSICPGWIDWPGKNRPVTEAFRAAAIREMPVGRTGTAQDVAGAAVFLASNLAEYVNGVALDVNGGLYMA